MLICQSVIFNSGNADNAIPHEAQVQVCFSGDVKQLQNSAMLFELLLKKELKEESVKLEICEFSGAVPQVLTADCQYKLLSALIKEAINAAQDIPVAKGNRQDTMKSTGYGFTMQVNNASVNLDECRFNVTLSNTSLIGFASNGSPRISTGNVVKQDVSLPLGKGEFIISGLNRKEVVKSKSGIPWLMDIPYLGYLFSTESSSIKNSRLVVAASCEWASPPECGVLNTTKRQQRWK